MFVENSYHCNYKSFFAKRFLFQFCKISENFTLYCVKNINNFFPEPTFIHKMLFVLLIEIQKIQ